MIQVTSHQENGCNKKDQGCQQQPHGDDNGEANVIQHIECDGKRYGDRHTRLPMRFHTIRSWYEGPQLVGGA